MKVDKDYSQRIISFFCQCASFDTTDIKIDVPVHLLGMSYVDIIHAVILIEKELDVNIVDNIDKNNILDYAIKDFISVCVREKAKL